MEPLFTLRIDLEDQGIIDIPIPTIEQFLEDKPLANEFKEGHVHSCTVYCGMERIAGLPIMEWKRLRDTVLDNATKIFSVRYKRK